MTTTDQTTRYLEPTQDTGRAFMMRGIVGTVVTGISLSLARAEVSYRTPERTVGHGNVGSTAQLESFLAFAFHGPYLAGIGHRTAALEGLPFALLSSKPMCN